MSTLVVQSQALQLLNEQPIWRYESCRACLQKPDLAPLIHLIMGAMLSWLLRGKILNALFFFLQKYVHLLFLEGKKKAELILLK